MSENQPSTENLLIARFLAIAVVLVVVGSGVLVFMNSSKIFSAFNLGDSRTAEAEKSLREKIASDSDGSISLDSFAKTDGQPSEAFGVKLYSLDFTGEITFHANGFWRSRDTIGGGKTTFLFAPSAGIFPGLNGTLQVSAGDQAQITGMMSGEKTENGWHFSLSDCHFIQK